MAPEVAVDYKAAAPDRAAAVPEADNKLAVVEVEADLPAADTPDNKEAATASKEVAAADTEDACLEVHTICSNRNSTPSTSPLRLVSKSIGNNCKTSALPPRTPA